MILMGIHKVPRAADYWSTDPRLAVPGVSNIMPVQRWRKLSQYLHLVDNRDEPNRQDPNRDRLFKVRPVLDMCNRNFKSGVYGPNRELSIAEAMIGFKGRCHMKQYMPAKPIKWGLKAWMLADAHNGYCVHADIYTGTKDGQGRTEGLGHNVVMDLAQHIANKNFHLYFDNYFTSPKLLTDLKSIGTYACGTVRAGRKGLPPSFKEKKKVDRGVSSFLQNGSTIAVRWRDNKDVFLLSTNCDNAISETSRRVGGTNSAIACPKVVKLYNKYKGGVDLSDQARSYYPVGRKARKYWKYILWFFVDICLINSWILYKGSIQQKPK